MTTTQQCDHEVYVPTYVPYLHYVLTGRDHPGWWHPSTYLRLPRYRVGCVVRCQGKETTGNEMADIRIHIIERQAYIHG